jgi:hypothetical protein
LNLNSAGYRPVTGKPDRFTATGPRRLPETGRKKNPAPESCVAGIGRLFLLYNNIIYILSICTSPHASTTRLRVSYASEFGGGGGGGGEESYRSVAAAARNPIDRQR